MYAFTEIWIKSRPFFLLQRVFILQKRDETLILMQIVTYNQTKESREKHEKPQIVSSLK